MKRRIAAAVLAVGAGLVACGDDDSGLTAESNGNRGGSEATALAGELRYAASRYTGPGDDYYELVIQADGQAELTAREGLAEARSQDLTLSEADLATLVEALETADLENLAPDLTYDACETGTNFYGVGYDGHEVVTDDCGRADSEGLDALIAELDGIIEAAG